MAISLQADSTLPQGYILVDGQRVASVSTTGGLSATLAANTVTTSSLVSGSVTAEKLASNAISTQTISNSAITPEKMSGGQSGSAPVYGCRAWVNFDATRNAAGTAVLDNTDRFIRASGNVSNVLRTAQGCYEVQFTLSMPTTAYAVTGTARPEGGTNNPMEFYSFTSSNGSTYSDQTPTLSSVRITTINNNTAGVRDSTSVSVFVIC